MFRNRTCVFQMPDVEISDKISYPLKLYKTLTQKNNRLHTKIKYFLSLFRNLIVKISLLIIFQQENQSFLLSFDSFPTFNETDINVNSFSQTTTTQYWTCDGPNRQLHVGRSADQRRWHRTVDSGRMDPVDYEVQHNCSYCATIFSYRPVNNLHRDKSWKNSSCVVSFRMGCFTVLRTG